MDKFGSVNELLDFAIDKEEEANKFYTELAGKMDRPAMQQVFQEFAKEELKHKEKLLGIKAGKSLESAVQKITDLKIGDYLVDVEPSQDIDYQEALILAMKKEKASFKLYNNLAATTEDNNLQNLLLGLAQEEAKHKLRLEMEYDENFLTEKW